MPTKTTTPKTSKVTAKKSAVTKTTTKKSSKAKINFKAMVCAADGECFWTRDGRILQDLADLHMAFGSMDEEVFLHHVRKEKNDFADWVEHVLQDLDCAVALRKAKKPDQAYKTLTTHLQKYDSN